MKEESFKSIVNLNLVEVKDGMHIFSFQVLKDSPIFKGHFPHVPVLPGVVMVSSIKKAVELINKTKANLLTAPVIKFLAVINPLENAEFKLKISLQKEGENSKVDASIFDEERIYFKMKAVYL